MALSRLPSGSGNAPTRVAALRIAAALGARFQFVVVDKPFGPGEEREDGFRQGSRYIKGWGSERWPHGTDQHRFHCTLAHDDTKDEPHEGLWVLSAADDLYDNGKKSQADPS